MLALLAISFATAALATPLQLRTATVTGDTVAYASGDLVGGKLALTDPNANAPISSGVIRSVVVLDLAAQTGNLDVVFFSADPASTTFTNNAAFDIHDSDLPNIIATIQLQNAVSFVDNSMMQRTVGTVIALEVPFVITSGQTLYAAIVARAARTQTTNTDLTLKVYIEPT